MEASGHRSFLNLGNLGQTLKRTIQYAVRLCPDLVRDAFGRHDGFGAWFFNIYLEKTLGLQLLNKSSIQRYTAGYQQAIGIIIDVHEPSPSRVSARQLQLTAYYSVKLFLLFKRKFDLSNFASQVIHLATNVIPIESFSSQGLR